MTEEWRAVVGHEGKYEVSSFGRIRSVDYATVRSNGAVLRVKGRIRKLKPDGRGYPRISLNGKAGTELKVHAAVMAAFVGPRPQGMEVRHRDGNAGNPRLDNLCYATHRENSRDMLVHGTANLGERSPNAKLTADHVRQIRASKDSLSVMAKQFGVSFGTIGKIRRRERWGHIA